MLERPAIRKNIVNKMVNNRLLRNLALVVILLAFVQTVVAQDLHVTKTVSVSEVQPNEWFTITVMVENTLGVEVTAYIIEPQPEIFEFRDYEPFEQPYSGLSYIPPSISLNRTVPASSFIEEEFVVRIAQIGNHTITKTTVNTVSDTYFSNYAWVWVLCNDNGLCESDEDYQNCPADCLSGSPDDLCDFQEDNILDPDCPPGYDPDYVPEHCYNGVRDMGELGVDCGHVCGWDCEAGPLAAPEYDEPCHDSDGDGYYAEGGTCGIVDCDDSLPFVNPGATEVCDSYDNDCDGQVDEDCEEAIPQDAGVIDVGEIAPPVEPEEEPEEPEPEPEEPEPEPEVVEPEASPEPELKPPEIPEDLSWLYLVGGGAMAALLIVVFLMKR